MAHADADDGDLPPAPAKKKSPAEEEAEKRRKKLTPGSLMKGLIRSGAGDATPAEGDQVVLHCTTRTMDGIIVNSTRREHGALARAPRCAASRSRTQSTAAALSRPDGSSALRAELLPGDTPPGRRHLACGTSNFVRLPLPSQLPPRAAAIATCREGCGGRRSGVGVGVSVGCDLSEVAGASARRAAEHTAHKREEVACMDSLHLVHVKLLAADLLSLTSRHTSPPSFARCGRTVARAEIVGVVVSHYHREKFLQFLVDDGTGCVPCVLWLNHQYLNANTSSRLSDSDPTAEMALKMSELVSLGTLLRVRGRIVLYRGAIQIAVRDVVLEKDPNVEVLHWLQCVRMAKEFYDPRPPSA